MKWTRLNSIRISCLVVAVILLSCSDDGAVSPPVVAPGPALFLTGNDHGMLRPCGCSKPVLGGISRRATLLNKESARGAVIAFGSAIATGGRQQELKIETFLQAWESNGVQCYVVGDEDMHVGGSYWKNSAAQMTAIPLVNLNLMLNGKRLFSDHATVKLGTETVVVTGIVDPSSPHLTDPALNAVSKPDVSGVLVALGKDEDRRCLVLFGTGEEAALLKFATESGLRQAALQLFLVRPGISDIPTSSMIDGDVVSLELGKKGRDVLELPWPNTGKLIRHTLDASVASDPDSEELLSFYRESVAFEDLLSTAPLIGEAKGKYAGNAACAMCHKEAAEKWSHSRHAHAFATLEKTGDTLDPECIGCHVVGFGLRGGYEKSRSDLRNVNCEACHGPGADHVANRTPTPGGKLGEAACVRCHDLDNSPYFDFKTYWAKIAHR